VDRLFGEIVIACGVLGKKPILTDDNDVSAIISTLKTGAEIVPKSELLDALTSGNGQRDGEVRIDIDKAFPVKGIGTVALGIVARGTVNAHDKLYHNGKQVEIKSIESQDEDIKQAGVWTRVGLAMKGVDHSEIEKGDLFTASPAKKALEVEADIMLSSIAGEQADVGRVYGFASGFNYTNATVLAAAPGKASFRLDRAIGIQPGDQFLLFREKAPRIFGGGKVAAVKA
jgi:selenocysteine-specific translation elongation factor